MGSLTVVEGGLINIYGSGNQEDVIVSGVVSYMSFWKLKRATITGLSGWLAMDLLNKWTL